MVHIDVALSKTYEIQRCIFLHMMAQLSVLLRNPQCHLEIEERQGDVKRAQ